MRFGNPRSTCERVWRYRSFPWLEDLWRDLRFALRGLGKTPGFTIIAILVIAVGIRVNMAVFSVLNTALLKPLIFPDQDSLVDLVTRRLEAPAEERVTEVQDMARADEQFLESGGI